MPIVFTSMIFNEEDFNSIEKFGDIVYSVSQTPQVYLDCQVMEMDGELSITWDYVQELLDRDTIEHLFHLFSTMTIGLSKRDANIMEMLKVSDDDLNIIRSFKETDQEVILNYYGEICPIGVIGELFVCNPKMVTKYGNEEALPAGFLKHKSFGILFPTGNLAILNANGKIELKGKVNDLEKVNRNRINKKEIERALGNHPLVDKVYVTIQNNSRGNRSIVGYVVADPILNQNQLSLWIHGHLQEYMIPQKLHFVSSIPLLSDGRVDKDKLVGMKISPREAIDEFKTDTEKYLLNLWRNVLGLEIIHSDDNFFDLGGDSVGAIKIYADLQRKYSISLQEMFNYQTIGQLATVLDRTTKPDRSQIDIIRQSYIAQKNTPDVDISDKVCVYQEKNKKQLANLNNHSINYKEILLTGGTGYLGCHLIREIIENSDALLILLVRATSESQAEARVRSDLSFYFGENFYDLNHNRFEIHKADISQENLDLDLMLYKDLSNEVDCLINSAAQMSHLASYEDLYKSNVLSVENMIKFTLLGKRKVLLQVSTSQVSTGIVTESAPIFTEYDNLISPIFSDNYSRTKYEAEQLLFNARRDNQQLDIRIVRIGNIVFNSLNGKFQKNINDNAFYNMIKLMLTLHAAPQIDTQLMEFTFVDYVSAAIRLIISNSMFENQTLHLSNLNKMSITDFAKTLRTRTQKCFNKMEI